MVIFITLLVYGAKIPVFIEYIALHKIIFSPSAPLVLSVRHTLWQTFRVCQSFSTPNSKFRMRHTLWQTFRVCQSFSTPNSKFRIIINHFYSHCRGDWQIALTKQNFSDTPNSKFKIQNSKLFPSEP